MKKNISYIIIVILLMIIAAGGTYIVMSNKNNDEIKKSDNTDKKDDVKNKQNKLTDEELEEYIAYVPNTPVVYSAYKNTKSDVTSANKTVLVGQAIGFAAAKCESMNVICFIDKTDVDYNEKKSNYYSGTITLVNEALKKLYNISNYEFKNSTEENFYIGINRGIGYTYNDGYFGESPQGDGVYHMSSIDKYTMEDNNLIIYEYAAIIYDKGEETLNDYYTNHKKDLVAICNYDESCEENYFNEHKTEFTKYKHTFKKNDTGYYWYSTEVV